VPCPVFAGFTLAFALQLKKKHGKTSVKVVIHKHTIKIYKLHYQTGINQKDEGTEYDRGRDGGTNFTLRIKEEETRLILLMMINFFAGISTG